MLLEVGHRLASLGAEVVVSDGPEHAAEIARRAAEGGTEIVVAMGGDGMVGLVGSAVIFAAAFALIAREYVALDRAVQACLNAGYTCWPEPSAFLRYAVYACIALAEVIFIFVFADTASALISKLNRSTSINVPRATAVVTPINAWRSPRRPK